MIKVNREKRFSLSNFDCELPPEVRAELVPPRRSQILQRPAPDHAFRSRLVLASLAILMGVGGIATVITQPITSQRIAAQPTPTPASTPTPPHLETAPLLVSSPNDERFFVPEVRRTKYLHQIQMPYGETLIAHYLGDLPDQEALPQTGNHIGDEYSIGSYRFVWVAPYGADAGHWIDP
jgi:hypothetical protein